MRVVFFFCINSPTLFSLALAAPIITGKDTVKEGDSVVLTCTADGQSTESLRWSKDGGSLPLGADVSTPGKLSIASVDHSKHAGSYRCVDESENSSLPFNLTVQC